MKLSAGVEWSLHSCVVLSQAEAPVPAARLAQLHGISKTYLAKHLQSLARAGLIAPAEGRDGGYVLARAAARVTVLDVVEAVDGTDSTFRCTEIRQQGELAVPPQQCSAPCGIAAVMATADRAWRAALAAVTIADLAATLDPAARAGIIGHLVAGR